MELREMLIKEENFTEALKQEILPFIKENFRDDYIEAAPGVRLHYEYAINPEEKGAIVISHGFCEFAPKHYEMAYYFYKMGYSVFVPEHIGHGFSSREVSDSSKVHIKKFQDYVNGLEAFTKEVVIKKSLTEKYYLLGHSMGGAIGALYLEQHPDVYSKAILSSPMIALNIGGAPRAICFLVWLLSKIPGLNKSYFPGQKAFDGISKYPKCSSISENRYNYHISCRREIEEYQTYGGTWGWMGQSMMVTGKILKNADKIKCPLLLCQAGQDDLVINSFHEEFIKKCSSGKLTCFPDSRHEIFNATDEIIEEYYGTVFEFLA